MPIRNSYIIALSMLLAIIIGYVYYVTVVDINPHFGGAEDAVILFQFAHNFVDTGVISYYAGGPRAEGATDFLWMMILGGLYKIGVPFLLGTYILNIMGVMAIAVYGERILCLCHKTPFSYVRVIAFLIALLVSFLFEAFYSGFSVYFFGAFITATLYYVLKNDIKKSSIFALLLMLTRPDGFIVAFPLFVYLLFKNRHHLRLFFRTTSLYLIIPGLLYFFGRWAYFGEFLPLPFYVKSQIGKTLFVENSYNVLQHATKQIWYIIALLLFVRLTYFLWIYVIKQRNDYTNLLKNIYHHDKTFFDKIIPLALVLVCSGLFYSSMILEQNIGYRFFIGIYIVLMLLVGLFCRKNKYIFLVIAAFLQYPNGLSVIKNSYHRIENYNILLTLLGKELSPVKGASLLTTEAGYITYYSQWKAHDSWGLSTREFAKKLITPEDIERIAPDLMLANSHPSWVLDMESTICQRVIKTSYNNRDWIKMVENMGWVNMVKNINWIKMVENMARADGYKMFVYKKGNYKNSWIYPIWVNKNSPYYKNITHILTKKNLAIYKPCDYLEKDKYLKMRKGIKQTLSNLPVIAENTFTLKYDKENKNLWYVKKMCSKKDTIDRFFIHIIPNRKNDLPQHRQKFGFDNLDRRWNGIKTNNNQCIMSVNLPNYPINYIRTGQFNKDGKLWEIERLYLTKQQ